MVGVVQSMSSSLVFWRLLDDGQIAHLICVRLTFFLYDFLMGVPDYLYLFSSFLSRSYMI